MSGLTSFAVFADSKFHQHDRSVDKRQTNRALIIESLFVGCSMCHSVSYTHTNLNKGYDICLPMSSSGPYLFRLQLKVFSWFPFTSSFFARASFLFRYGVLFSWSSSCPPMPDNTDTLCELILLC